MTLPCFLISCTHCTELKERCLVSLLKTPRTSHSNDCCLTIFCCSSFLWQTIYCISRGYSGLYSSLLKRQSDSDCTMTDFSQLGILPHISKTLLGILHQHHFRVIMNRKWGNRSSSSLPSLLKHQWYWGRSNCLGIHLQCRFSFCLCDLSFSSFSPVIWKHIQYDWSHFDTCSSPAFYFHFCLLFFDV